MLRLIVIAIFVLTFVVQPFRIPSESMERTLLVGDFLLVNKAIFAPPGHWGWLLPYREVEAGDIVVFHFPENPPEHVVKRVIGVPGDRIFLHHGRVYRNGHLLEEPYALYLPAYPDGFRDEFPTVSYNYPGTDYHWWRRMQQDVQDGELVVPPGQYFVLGDNRNNSRDSRYWGFVPRAYIVGRPAFIYFSLRSPSSSQFPRLPDDKLGQSNDPLNRMSDFARWDRIFRVIR
jgi:signal peptidase I